MYKALVQAVRTSQACISIMFAACLLCLPAAALASSTGAISQSYNATTTDITDGTLLSLAPGSNTTVEPANSATNATNLEGIAADKPLVELSSNGQNTVQVVVGGVTPTLVSDINGTIKPGDRIAPSPISGVGMKATTPGEVIGTAQTSLSSVRTVDKTITTKSGKQVPIEIGMVPVAVNVSYYTQPDQSNIAAYIPPFLQNLANKVAGGKNISPIRVFIGSVVLILGLGTVLFMASTTIRNSIVSIKRNPLARNALWRGLADVFIAALGILVVTVVIVYVIVAK